MPDMNISSSNQIPYFVMICFPTIQSWQHWLSIPLALLLLLAIVANITMLAVIKREKSLREPMYYFLSILSVLDLVLCLTTTPKILGILCFNLKVIDLPSCFTQMYIINSFVIMESAAFLVMAYDRYSAICNPLRYNSVITKRFVAKALVFIVLRSGLVCLPYPLMASSFQYCRRNVIENCICSIVSVTSLACSDNTVLKLYQLVLAFGILGGDFIIILLSYFMILWAVLKLKTEGAAAKAFSTCISHLILISFFYTIILVLIFTNKMEKVIPTEIPILLNILHLLVPPALNPMVYGVRTKEIRHGVIKMLRDGQTIVKGN
ncbi:olfactory receptor 56A4-like, partial [Ambystoma mexicanum]|uniref:olfactory receptor 56A4-like n=1 Tax=Ambystoma mexicanum TaxID=8296 RepID=UPI0037E8C7F9